MVWREHFSHVIVENDSKILIDMIYDNYKFNGNVPILVHRIRKLLKLRWHVQINHTLREENRNTDWLANFSISMDHLNVFVLENSPKELQKLFFDNVSGACMPKNVRLT
ncbi:uncharacterized protein LOC123914696 [Trifolium pratense]|uniref:uncharacterized protein LOC123914696 n=1 Tax=Trifolium pratense TaxID=57577 RepID=UPI001E68FDAC|nr:uncharacterized protein LOC123914696 [Trifolium pratense]